MGVRCASEVFGTGGECDGGGRFGDKVPSAGADDVDAEEAVGGFVGKDLDPAVHLAKREGAAVGTERKRAFAILDAASAQFVFSLADGSDLRMGVYDARDGVVINVAVASNNVLDAGNSFLFG